MVSDSMVKIVFLAMPVSAAFVPLEKSRLQ